MKLSFWIAIGTLLAAVSSRGDAAPVTHIYSHLTTNAPADSVDIANSMSNLPGLSADRLYDDFVGRLGDYQKQLTTEASGQKRLLQDQLAVLSARSQGAIEREREQWRTTQRALGLDRVEAETPASQRASSATTTILRARGASALRTADQTDRMIDSPALKPRLSEESRGYLKRELSDGRVFTRSGLSLLSGSPATAGGQIAEFLIDLGYTKIRSAYEFCAGVLNGASQRVVELAEAMAHPLVAIRETAHALLQAVSQPGAFQKAGLEALLKVFVTLRYGSPAERGFAIGALAPDILANEGLSLAESAARNAAIAGAEALRASSTASRLGEALLTEIEASPVLKPLVTEAHQGAEGLAEADQISRGAAAKLIHESPEDAVFLGKNLARSDDRYRRDILAYAEKNQLTAGKVAIISEFKDGMSHFITRENYEKFVVGTGFLGDENGLFMTTSRTADELVTSARGRSSVFEVALGKEPGSLSKKELLRIDIPFDLSLRPSLPAGIYGGANQYFRYGGTTSGGKPEIIIRRLRQNELPRAQSVGVLKP